MVLGRAYQPPQKRLTRVNHSTLNKLTVTVLLLLCVFCIIGAYSVLLVRHSEIYYQMVSRFIWFFYSV